MEKGRIESVLKEKIVHKDYESAINILNAEIKQVYIDKIKEYNKNFKFISTVDLAGKVEKYLGSKDVMLFKRYFIIMNEDSYPIYKLDCLMEIYNKLKKGGAI